MAGNHSRIRCISQTQAQGGEIDRRDSAIDRGISETWFEMWEVSLRQRANPCEVHESANGWQAARPGGGGGVRTFANSLAMKVQGVMCEVAARDRLGLNTRGLELSSPLWMF